ncbi:MAG: hypothetical protein IPH93_15790 [Saprospiraceae bacterium]|nr:hypothetical protein [Saprospiraceae bacterium]
MNPIDQYFNEEKFQCSVGLVISILFLAVAAYFLYQPSSFYKGLAYSIMPISFLFLMICTMIVLRTPKDIVRVNSYYTTEPLKLKTEELPRMNKIMNSFVIIKKVELGMLLISLIICILFWKNDLIKGITIGLIVQSVGLYYFDYHASTRGAVYLEFLKSI